MTNQEIKTGDFILWYEDDLNWGIDEVLSYPEASGVYEVERGGIIDIHVIGKVTNHNNLDFSGISKFMKSDEKR